MDASLKILEFIFKRLEEKNLSKRDFIYHSGITKQSFYNYEMAIKGHRQAGVNFAVAHRMLTTVGESWTTFHRYLNKQK